MKDHLDPDQPEQKRLAEEESNQTLRPGVNQDESTGPQTMFDLIHADLERNFEEYPFNNKRFEIRHRVWRKLHVLSGAYAVARRRWYSLSEPIHTSNAWKYIIPVGLYFYIRAKNTVNIGDTTHRLRHEVLPTSGIDNQGTGYVDYHTLDYLDFFKKTDWSALNRVEFNQGSLLCDFESHVTHQQTNFFVGLMAEDNLSKTYMELYAEETKMPSTYFISGENYHTLVDQTSLNDHQKTFCQNMQSLGLKPTKWKPYVCNGFLSRWDTLPMRMESLFGAKQTYHKKSSKGIRFYKSKLFSNKFRSDCKKSTYGYKKAQPHQVKYVAKTPLPALSPVPKNHEVPTRHERLGAVLRTHGTKETLAHRRLIQYRMADTLMKMKQLIDCQLFYHKDNLLTFNLKNFFINPKFAFNKPIRVAKPGPNFPLRSNFRPARTDNSDIGFTIKSSDEYFYDNEETKAINEMPFYDCLRVDDELPTEFRIYEDLNADVQDFFIDRQHDLFHNVPADPTGSGEFIEDMVPEPDSPPYRFMSLTWFNDFSVVPEFQKTLFKHIDKQLGRFEEITPNSYLVYRAKNIKRQKWWQWSFSSKTTPETRAQLRKLNRIRTKIYVGKAPNLIRRVSGYTWPDMTLEECRRVAQYMFNPYEPSRAHEALIQVEIIGQKLHTWSLYENLLGRPDWCALQGLARKPLYTINNATDYFLGQPFTDRGDFVWGTDPKKKYNYRYLHKLFIHPLYPRPIDDHLLEETFSEDFEFQWVDRCPEEPMDDEELEMATMPFEQEELTVFHHNYCYGVHEAPAIEADYYFAKEQWPGFAVKVHLPTYDVINAGPAASHLTSPVLKYQSPKFYVFDYFVKPVYSYNPISKLHNHDQHNLVKKVLRTSNTFVIEHSIQTWKQVGKLIVFILIMKRVYKWSIYNANPFNNTLREWLTVFHTDTLEHWTCKDRVCMHNSGVTFQQVIGGEDLLEQFARTIYHLRCLQKPFGFLPLLDDQGRDMSRVGDAPLGYLLVGPPGTGKTFVARAVADTAGVPVMVFGRERFPEYTDPDAVIRSTGYIKKILELTHIFEAGRYYAPSIVFIDEIDSIAPTRYTRKHIDDDPEEGEILMSDTFDMIYGADPYRQIRSFAYWNTRIHYKHPQFDFMRTSLQHWQVSNGIMANVQYFEQQPHNFFCDSSHPTAYVDDIQETDLLPEPSADEVATLIRLLIELDGMNQREIVVIGSTNRPAALDPAVLRPGRLNKIVYLDLPDTSKRFKLLKAQSQDQVGGPIDWYSLTQQTAGFSPAHLDAALNVSRLKAIYSHVQKVPIKMAEFPDTEAKKNLHTMHSLKVGIQDTISPWTPYKRAMIRKSFIRLTRGMTAYYIYDAMNGYNNLRFALTAGSSPKRIQELYNSNQPIIIDRLPEGLDIIQVDTLSPAMRRTQRIRRRLSGQPEPIKAVPSPDRVEATKRKHAVFRKKVSKDIRKYLLFTKAYNCLESGDTSELDHLEDNTKIELIKFAAYATRSTPTCLFRNQLALGTRLYNHEMIALRPRRIFKIIRGQLIASNVQLANLPSPVAMMSRIHKNKGKGSMFIESQAKLARIQKNNLKDPLALQRSIYFAASKALIAFLVPSEPDNARYFSIWDGLFDEPETTRVQQRQIAQDVTRQCRLLPDFEDQVMIALAGPAGESFMLCHRQHGLELDNPGIDQSNIGTTDRYLANCIADIMVENNLWPYSSLTNHVANLGVDEKAPRPPKDADSLRPIRRVNDYNRVPLNWWGEKAATTYEAVENRTLHWEEYILHKDPVLERLQVVGFHYDSYVVNTINNGATLTSDLPTETYHIDLKSDFDKKFFSMVTPNFNALLHQQVTDHRTDILLTASRRILHILDTNRAALDYIAELLCVGGDLTYRELQGKLSHFFNHCRKPVDDRADLHYLHHLELIRDYEDSDFDDGCRTSIIDPGYEDGFEERYDVEYHPSIYRRLREEYDSSSSESDYEELTASAPMFDPGFDTDYQWDYDHSSSESDSEDLATQAPSFDPGFGMNDDSWDSTDSESDSDQEFELW